MPAPEPHLSTRRDQASGMTFWARPWLGRTVAGPIIAVGLAVIVGVAAGVATALAGLSTAIAAELGGGVLLAGIVGIAALQLPVLRRGARRKVGYC
jgi:hypothetical protein